MTHQNSNFSSSLLESFYSAKRITATVPARIVLTAVVLIGSSGNITLSALANPARSMGGREAPSYVIDTVEDQLSANIIYVNSATGIDGVGAGNSMQPFRTITKALKQAKAGIVVQLAPGTYTESSGEVFPLRIPTGVSVRGDETQKGQGFVISGGGSYISSTDAKQNVTILASSNTTISGVSISNPNIRGSGLWLESTNTIVKNNTFFNSKREGVLVTGTATPLIEANVFSRNNGNGISIGQKSKGEIRNNLFDNTGFGIAVTETASPLIVENRIFQNVDGIVVAHSATPVLRNNVIENNQRDGFVAISNAQPDLGTQESPGNNQIRNNGRYDVNNSTRSNIFLSYGNDITKTYCKLPEACGGVNSNPF